ncbi:MAG TPA: AarF/UbiB family protein [Acidimicrobiales bacterium]|nr:AarF/UbiB family protein [Acidimicrobiales bacterium]
MRRASVAGLAALGAIAAGGAGAAAFLSDDDRRNQLDRQLRVWRLTARRGLHWGVIYVRGRGADEQKRAELEEKFAIKTAQDVAEVLGGMKGAIMKAGQMISFVAEGLPPEAQAALATLQAEVPPMAPSLAESVVRAELGGDPQKLFLDWDPEPIAAASIGQVHKAVLHDGREVAVKVQYPGIDKAIKGDLDNAEMLYGLFASFALKNMDVKALVDELRARMADELDYRLEAKLQQEFADRYRGHPFIHVPDVVFERSAQRVMTSEWVDGLTWAQFEEQASDADKQRASEILFRFAEGSIWHHRVFNGDPHPGNYRFRLGGPVTFLDFGLVKRWGPGELESLSPTLDAALAQDPEAMERALIAANFLPPKHTLTPQRIYDYVSTPWIPFQQDYFEYTREFVGATIEKMIDLQGEYGDVIRQLNMPPSYVILDRVVWGLSALWGRMHARGNWKALLAEYRKGAPPSTELGKIEEEWRKEKAAAPSA